VIEMHDQSQQWLGVADIMRAEAHEEADAQLSKYAARANGIAGITPERVIREGEKAQEILGLIDEDEDIFVLVLAAGTGSEGPGPLVATIGRATLPTRSSTRCHEMVVFAAAPTRLRSLGKLWRV
jgi:hypothetical protein